MRVQKEVKNLNYFYATLKEKYLKGLTKRHSETDEQIKGNQRDDGRALTPELQGPPAGRAGRKREQDELSGVGSNVKEVNSNCLRCLQ